MKISLGHAVKIQVLLVVMLGFGLMGCGPVISKNILNQADRGVDFAQLQTQPQKWRGQVVVLGGKVMSVSMADGGSWLWVNQQELGPKLWPLDKSASGGQFVVFSPKFLNSSYYVQGRKVTVAGTVRGQKDKALLIDAKEIHLWEYPFELHSVPPDWYAPPYEHWFVPPYFDPYVPTY